MPAPTASRLDVRTPAGTCPVELLVPPGPGPHPGLLLYMDVFGPRPALLKLARRHAEAGYAVAVPDVFYRSAPYTADEVRGMFSSPATRAEVKKRFVAPALAAQAVEADTGAVLGALAVHLKLKPRMGTLGFCLGGGLALRVAALVPQRFAAVATFHAGNVVGEGPDSPHLAIPQLKAEVLMLGASEDSSFPEAQKAQVVAALKAAGVKHTVETVPARHGWMLEDTPAADAAQAEKGLAASLALFKRTL